MNTQILKNRTKAAFTLVELMVSICVFTLFIGIAINAYLNIVHSQNESNNNRKMYSEVRSFVDLISTEMRLGTVDYDCYNAKITQWETGDAKCPASGLYLGSDGVTKELVLISTDKQKIVDLKYDDINKKVVIKRFSYNSERREYDAISGLGEESFSSAVIVDNLSFSVFPNVNPYSSDKTIYYNAKTQFQPKVSVLLSTRPANDLKGLNVMNFQTTISSRVYNR